MVTPTPRSAVFVGKLSYRSALAGIFFAALFLLTIHQIGDLDTGYHLKTGEYIVEHRTVPHYDIFSYSAEGTRWIAHYWLSDVFFFLTAKAVGLWGLIVSIAVLAVVSYAIVLKTAFLRTRDSLLPLLLLMPLAGLTFELWVVRPQVFSYLFVALLIFLLERRRLHGGRRTLWILPLLFFLWGNMHGSVVFGLAIFGLWLAAALQKERRTLRRLVGPGLSFSAAILGALANPNGYQILLYLQSVDPSVLEFHSILEFLGDFRARLFLLLMLSVTGFLLWRAFAAFRAERHFDIFRFGLLAAAFLMPIIAIRHVGLFPIIALPLLSSELDGYLRGKNIVLSASRRIQKYAFAFGFLLMAAALFSVPFSAETVNHKTLPVRAADFLEREGVEGPLFNTQPHGGYLIWRFWPEQKVFIDGRNDVYINQQANADYLAIMLQENGWERLVDEKYNIRAFLLWYRDGYQDVVGNLVAGLTRESQFRLVYWDETSLILLRDSGVNKAIADRHAYRFIHPYRDASDIPPQYRDEALQEIRRAIQENPDSSVLQRYETALLLFGR